MRYIFIVFLILAIITCGYLYHQIVQLSKQDTVVVFFIRNTPTDFLLVPVPKKTQKTATPQLAMDLLLQGPGPEEDLMPTIPLGTKLLKVETKDSIAIVNFSSDIKTRFIGGSQLEGHLVNAIVLTLLQFENINRVEILVEGERIESIGGHIFIDTYLP